jgi:octopine/nopaline transport system permease protein/arginine/ornithine transport system permease protein
MQWSIVLENFPILMGGLWITLQITSLAVIIGFGIAILLSLMNLSGIHLLKWLSTSITLFFRGTPLLVQLYLIYYGSGQFRDELEVVGLWGYFREAYFCAVLTLSLNTGAYTAEIFKGAIKSIDKGQVEAGKAFGMSTVTLYQRVIFPNVFRISWASYSNEIIFIMQATSLVSIITLLDLTGVAGRIISQTFAIYEVYIAVAIVYLIITYTLVFIFGRVEKRLRRHEI